MIRPDQIDLLVQAHVAGVGLNGAAEHAGMSRSSAWRYMKRPEVQQQIVAARAERRSSMVAHIEQVRALADLTMDALVQVLDDDPDHGTVIRLAGVILPEVRNLSMLDLAERIEALERSRHERNAA